MMDQRFPSARQGALTPRQRQEIESQRPLQTRQEVPLVRAQTTYSTLVTARADAYFKMEGLWAANVDGSARTVSVALVAPAGSPSAANALVFALSVAANTTVELTGASKILIPPDYTLQVTASANDMINVYGWGMNIAGEQA
ncbi:MAG: hypothetical protein HC889_20820 [Synechococcaceae cyanobacterium SM1_2_3]|nr:hypothetical protein [Synechococcaceae cyanobacterium SM1_2_3]